MDPWSSLYSQLAREPQARPETLSQKIRQRAIKEDYQNQPLTPRCMCTQVICVQAFIHVICVQAFTHAYKHMWTPHIHKDTHIQNEKKKELGAPCSTPTPIPCSLWDSEHRGERRKVNILGKTSTSGCLYPLGFQIPSNSKIPNTNLGRSEGGPLGHIYVFSKTEATGHEVQT